MQNYHTRLNSTLELKSSAKESSSRTIVPIGVSSPSSPAVLLKPSISKGVSYSQKSKSDAMLGNLSHCSEYLQLQVNSMNELIRSTRLLGEQFRKVGSTTYEYLIFIQAISSVLKKEYNGFPLFDFGESSPLRVHLNLNGERSTYCINPLPLRGNPSVNSLICSTRASFPFSTDIINECQAVYIQSILDLQKEKNALQEIINKATPSLKMLNQKSNPDETKKKVVTGKSVKTVFCKLYNRLVSNHSFQPT